MSAPNMSEMLTWPSASGRSPSDRRASMVASAGRLATTIRSVAVLTNGGRWIMWRVGHSIRSGPEARGRGYLLFDVQPYYLESSVNIWGMCAVALMKQFEFIVCQPNSSHPRSPACLVEVSE